MSSSRSYRPHWIPVCSLLFSLFVLINLNSGNPSSSHILKNLVYSLLNIAVSNFALLLVWFFSRAAHVIGGPSEDFSQAYIDVLLIYGSKIHFPLRCVSYLYRRTVFRFWFGCVDALITPSKRPPYLTNSLVSYILAFQEMADKQFSYYTYWCNIVICVQKRGILWSYVAFLFYHSFPQHLSAGVISAPFPYLSLEIPIQRCSGICKKDT